MEDGLHIFIGRVNGPVVEIKVVLVVLVNACLVKDAQHLVKPVVDLSMETRYLNDNAIVIQAVYELVGDALNDRLVIIVEGLVTHIDYRFLDVTYGMPQQINGHHGQGMPVGTVAHDVLWILVMYAEILAETQRFCWQPRLLQFYQDELFLAIILKDGGSEVNTKDGQALLLSVDVLVWTHFNLHNILFQQCRENSACNAFILHEVFEHSVVDRICNCHHSCMSYVLQNYKENMNIPNKSAVLFLSDVFAPIVSVFS